MQLTDKLEETIIREFATPRFLINKTPENRDIAYMEFEAFISGSTANTQRYFNRGFELQWYERLVKLALVKKGFSGEVLFGLGMFGNRSGQVTSMLWQKQFQASITTDKEF